jgi:hypothetical protein
MPKETWEGKEFKGWAVQVKLKGCAPVLRPYKKKVTSALRMSSAKDLGYANCSGHPCKVSLNY